MNREPIGKTLRFEIFKRDKFTCQYCGNKAPEVILELDHIEPVSKGGDNNISNLITSCFDCNRGKRNKKIDDNTTIEKQHKQLELLQERKSQLEQMLKWRKELLEFDGIVTSEIVRMINEKISPLGITKNAILDIEKLTKKYEYAKIIEAIDISARTYLKYNSSGVTRNSADDFINRIGGICYNLSKSPIDQNISYICGYCRKSISGWKVNDAMEALNNYVNALSEKGWSVDSILDDLKEEVLPMSKRSKQYFDWIRTINGWLKDINDWTDKK